MYAFGVDCEPFVPTIRKISALSPAITSASRAWPPCVDDDRAVGRERRLADVVARDLGAGAAEDHVGAGRAARAGADVEAGVRASRSRGRVSADPVA